MWFSIGVVEFGLIGSAAITTLLLRVFRLQLWPTCAVATGCLAVAACLTPADPVSTLLMAVVGVSCFEIGKRTGSIEPTTNSTVQ